MRSTVKRNEIYREMVSGKSIRNRPELEKTNDRLETGDMLVVGTMGSRNMLHDRRHHLGTQPRVWPTSYP